MQIKNHKIKTLFFVAIFIVFGLGSVFAIEAKAQSETESFYIDSSYDLYARKEIEAVLIRSTGHLYFYIEKPWWNNLAAQEQNSIKIALFDLGEEFENKIYPVLTSNFGQEWKPGIDGDEHITVLVHPMKENRAGYFRTSDQYYKLQIYDSNEREMVYLNSEFIATPLAKSFLSHEFTHLITFNQKDVLRNISEETWLNEARAEYIQTLLGYDTEYKGTNLERRVKDFLEKPSDSLTEWLNKKEDYGAVNLFTQYLVDHYGLKILVDSLRSSKIGISSINEALAKNGFKEDFAKIFTDWTITVLVNDCPLGDKYCYKNQNLKNLRIVPESNFLPTATEIALSVYSQIKDWSAKWQRIFGGKGDLTLKFNGKEGVKFKVPYVLCDYANKCIIGFFNLDEQQTGEIFIPEFSSKYSSLSLIPSIQQKLSGFSGDEPTYLFSWEVRTKELSKENPELIKKLLEQIASLEAEIARVQAQIDAILASRGQKISCGKFERNLYFGISNDLEVRCLQEFLKSQGAEIYPEGLVTGNFLSLTQAAVIRFQEKYKTEILTPLGLEKGTGFVGSLTCAKINELLGK